MRNFTIYFFTVLSIFVFSVPTAQAQHVLDAAIFRDNVGTSGKYFLFRGDEYARYDNFLGAFDVGYPRKIDATDSEFAFGSGSAFNDGVDAVVRMPISGVGTFELFFQGPSMVISAFNGMTPNFSQATPIASRFPGLPQDWKDEGIDAAFSYNGSLFLIKGNSIKSFNVSNGFSNPPENFTTTIVQWTNNSVFTGIDAAYYDSGTNREVYIRGRAGWDLLFSGGFNTTPFEVNDRFTPWPSTWKDGDNYQQAFDNGDANVNAQIVDGTCNDDNKFKVNVDAGTGLSLGSQVNVERVEMFVSHPFIADLDISLTSPAGKTVLLTSDNGGGASNLGSASAPLVFNMSATQAITDLPDGTSPQGSFRPEGDFADFHDGTNPTGEWILEVCDDAATFVGTLESFNLVLSGIPIAKCKTGVSVDLSAAGMATISTSDIDDGSTSWDMSAPMSTALNFTNLTCSNAPSTSVVLTVTGNNGLTATCSSQVTVNDVTDPSASCNQNIPLTLPGGGGSTTLQATLVDNNSSDNCSISAYDVNPSSFNTAGNFNVTLTVTDVSGNTDECVGSVSIIASSVDELTSVSKFDIYPNPATGHTVVDLEFSDNDEYTLEIANSIGQVVEIYQVIGNTYQKTIDVSSMAQGMYTLSVRSDQGIQSKRLVVAK